MKPRKKKTVVFTIEIGVRELASKCFLALHCLEKGFRVYISSFYGIEVLRNRISSSVFFHKSTWDKKALNIKTDLGASFVFLDEEAGIAIPRSHQRQFCNGRYASVTPEKYDKIFTIGPAYKEYIQALPNANGVEIYDTGWPRIDLWRPEFAKMYSDDVDSIRSEHGTYYLLISSFGATSEERFLEKQRIAREKNYGTENLIRIRSKAFFEYLRMLKELSKRLPEDRKIVVRPHPSEDIDEWKDLLTTCPNIAVIRHGDVAPWVLGAEAVISLNSITGAQASLYGIPFIAYRAPMDSPISDTPIFDIALKAYTVEDLLHLLETSKQSDPMVVRTKAINVLASEVSSLRGEFASKKIARILDSIDTEPTEPIGATFSQRIGIVIQYLVGQWSIRLRHVVKRIRGKTIRRGTKDKLPDGINRDQLEAILRRQAGVIGYSLEKVIIRQISPELVVIEQE